MIKRILLPLDSSPYTDTAMEIGCDLAERHGAELTGLVILDIPGIEKSIGPVPLVDFTRLMFWKRPYEKRPVRASRHCWISSTRSAEGQG